MLKTFALKGSFMNRFSILFILSFLAFVGACTDTKYLQEEQPFIEPILPEQEIDDRIYTISDFIVDKEIDVILVIDNSGSMGGIQSSVVKNAKLFFETFAKDQTVDWKIGIVSTDKREEPYIGFENSFDSSLVDPRDPTSFDRVVQMFQNAVERLGTSGDASEYTYYNLKRHLDRFNSLGGKDSFQRTNAHLVTIMISDEEEQSVDGFGGAFEANSFFSTMQNYVASDKVVRFYGAIDHKDLSNCSGFGDPWLGSEFEKLISISGGFVISACINNFGLELARIGEDIANLIEAPRLLLKRRPKVPTLKVYYEDQELKPGAEELGGMWFYEEITNTINFYNIDFVQDPENDEFRVEFDVDDGIGRGPWTY